MTAQMDAREDDAYARIARWYDVEHDAFVEDVEAYSALIAGALGARGQVVEVGGGTGRLAAALALAGYSVTFVEPSPAMRARAVERLARLPERVARRVTSVAGSATDLRLAAAQRFDVALIGANTFAHLLSAREREAALRALAAALRPGALLLLDVDLFGPRRLVETTGQLWTQGVWTLPDGEGELAHFVVALPEGEPDVATLQHFYDVYPQDGPVLRTTTRMRLALLSRDEIERALRQTGYAVETVYGDYDLTPFEPESPRALVVARRA